MIDNFSFTAQKAILFSESLAKEFSHPTIGSEHLLLAILNNEDLLLTKELEKQGIKYRTFFDKTKYLYQKEKKIKKAEYSLEVKQILQDSIKLGMKNKETLVSIETLSYVLLTSKNTVCELLINLGIDLDLIIKKLSSVSKRKSELLSITDLHLLGMNNKDPLIGRDNEIIQLIYALSRRNKPNAILVGEPGVGKTALVEELGKRLINNQIPLLKNKLIYELDLASTVSGTKYRGEFEEKLKKIIKKVKEDGNAILFIDEIHNVIKAGGAEGAIDASNILKPYLARGDIQLIGATTFEEFNDSFEKDKALKRRFQIIDVNEPSLIEVENILLKIKPIYEDYYNISIDDELLSLIVNLSNEYILNQRFPDKAIELLDNSCVISKKTLKKEDILITMNKLYNVNLKDKEKIDNLEFDLINSIVGQTKVKQKIIQVLNNEKAKSLLFIGQNGCGKNTIAKLIAKDLFNDSFINIDIDNYMDSTAIFRLSSNSNSYIGEQISPLVKTLKEKPNSVVIVEGIEKATSDISMFFKNILEKGFFLDSKGIKINTKNALFIFLVNKGNLTNTNFKLFSNSDASYKKILEENIGYKFVNLIDEIIEFDGLTQMDYKKIVVNELLKQDLLFEISLIEDVDEQILKTNGGNVALKTVKELIKEKNIKKLIKK